MKNKVYRENKEYREINKYGGKGNIGKLGKLCWGNEDKGLKKVVRCTVLNAHVRFYTNFFALRSYARYVLVANYLLTICYLFAKYLLIIC